MTPEGQGSRPQDSLWSSSETAELWQQDVQRRQRDFAAATYRMLEAAELQPGDRVLDIAAGTGDQSLLAARIVGPSGSILATDISADMLTIAARVALHEGLTNISTRIMDAQQLDLEDEAFDAVICRLGLMLLTHPETALREIHRVLKPGARLAALVWSAPEHNPLLALPLAIVATYTSEATSHPPNPLALADPSVFERELTEAGFHEVSTSALPFESHYASVDAYMYSTGSRLTAETLGQLSHQEQENLLREVRQVVSQFEGPHGLVAPAELLLGAGSRGTLSHE
jgi:ubiquinone/menaquinone biosynthesis C-methylase UbiE